MWFEYQIQRNLFDNLHFKEFKYEFCKYRDLYIGLSVLIMLDVLVKVLYPRQVSVDLR